MANSAEYANLSSLENFIKHGQYSDNYDKNLSSIFTGEGYRGTAYDDGFGNWTIGYGRIYNEDGSRVKQGDKVGNSEEDIKKESALFRKEVIERRDDIIKLINEDSRLPRFTDKQIDSLTSFSFNMGWSNLKNLIYGDHPTKQFTKNEPRSFEEISTAMFKYNKAKNRNKEGNPKEFSPGLFKRRLSEHDLFTNGDGFSISSPYAINYIKYIKNNDAEIMGNWLAKNLGQANILKAATYTTPRDFDWSSSGYGTRTEDVVDKEMLQNMADNASMSMSDFPMQGPLVKTPEQINPYIGREDSLINQTTLPEAPFYPSDNTNTGSLDAAINQSLSNPSLISTPRVNELTVPEIAPSLFRNKDGSSIQAAVDNSLPSVPNYPNVPLQSSSMPLSRPEYFNDIYKQQQINIENKNAANAFIQKNLGPQNYSTGEDYVVPYTPPLYEMHGSDWGPQHQAMLENAIGGIRRRLGDKVPIEKILEAIPSSIITDIRAQINHMKKKEIEGLNQAGKKGRDIPPGPPPPMPQQYINDASQLNKPPLRIHADVLENQRERKEWERLFGEDGLYPLGTTPKAVAPSNIKTYPDQQMSSLDRRFHPSDDLAMGKFTENTDTVPAMLTEGEAVIPAEAAQLKRNRAEIQRMVNEGREIQERKDELNISAFDNSYNEALAKLNEEENKNYFLNIPDRDSLTPPGKPYEPKSKYDVGFTKRLGEWWEGVGEGAKKLFYPYGPGGLSNPTVEEEKVQPKQPSTPPNYFEMENLLDKQVPPPIQGPVKPEAIPQQYINDASDYTPEQKENQNKIIESLPSDVELEQKMINLDREELQRMVTDAKKYTDANAFQFKDVTDWIEKNLGFNKQDVYRAILYYVGGRLSGGSHGGSLRWAAKQVVQESGARNTAIAKAQATAKGDIMKAMTDEAKRKLKDGYFTRAGSKLINAAIRAQDFSQLNMLLADTENPSLYNQMAMISDLSKRKPYYMRGTNPLNNMIMAPHKYKNTYVWQDPDSGEILEIPMDQVEEYKKDIDYDNMFNKFANDFKGYHNADKADPKNNNTNYKKLKRHYNVEGESDYRSKIKNISERYNISPDRVFSLVTSLLDITEDNIDPKDLNVDLESAIGSLIIDPTSMPDNDKLKNFNQKDINQIVEDFGGNPGTVTKHMQTIDEVLAGNPNANPPIPQKLVKDIKHEEVDAEIDKTNLSEEIKIKLKAIPNPYWKMVYVEFYTSRG